MFIPLKKFGQNFLQNKDILKRIVESADINENDTILEIGPGLGDLTKQLLNKTHNVIAIEKDKRLINKLSNLNIKLINQDVLDYKIDLKHYKVIANLPYYITLPIIRKFIESKNPPKLMILLIQKEVAEKICSNKSSLPKLAIQFFAKTEILFNVSKREFKPMPKVDGSVIKIYDIQKNIPNINIESFFKTIKLGFQFKRKTLLNNLSTKFDKHKIESILNKLNIPLNTRSEDVDLNLWISIVEQLNLMV